MDLKRITQFCFLSMLIILGACKKEAGPGGKNIIKGSIVFKNGATGNNDVASKAEVSIAYGSSGSANSFDKTILCNADGSYQFETLRKGDYFIKATYVDENGFTYSAPGAVITFNHRKKEAEVNLILE